MRKFIRLEKIRENRRSIQKKLNKKWLNRGIVTCVIAIAVISEIRVYENRKIKITYNFGNELEHLFSSVYSVESEEKVI